MLGLIGAELATAFAAIAENAVLPLASGDLHGTALFGAATAAPTLASVPLLVLGPAVMRRLGASRALLVSTTVFVSGVLLTCLAPTMLLVVVGRLVQGGGQALVAGIGYGAIGALYEREDRTRLLALLSSAWLVPAVLGPPLNAAVAAASGWRWAMAWPAILFVAARLVIGGAVDLVPAPERRGGDLPIAAGVVSAAGLGIASAGGSLGPSLGALAWFAGLAAAGVGAFQVLRVLAGEDGRRRRLVRLYAIVCVAYFGGQALVSLEVLEVLGGTVLVAGLAYTGSAVAWSVVGLSPLPSRLRRVAPVLGAAGATTAATAIAVLTLAGVSGAPAIALVVACGILAGGAVGIAFPAMNAAGFDGAAGGDAVRIGTAYAFGDVFAIAFSGLLGTGVYSLGERVLPHAASVGAGYALVAAVGGVALLLAVRRRRLRPQAA